MVYIFDELDKFNDKDLDKYTVLLSEERINKRDRFKKRIDKLTSTLAFLLLRYALCKELGNTEIPIFNISRNNKPDLKRIRFNLSHCKDAVMCGLSEEEIGVDILDYDSINDNCDNIYKPIFTKKEISELETGSLNMRFADLWTLKESYGKMHSFGIIYDMNKTDFSGIHDKWVDRYDNKFFCGRSDRYSYSICSLKVMKINHVTYEELKQVLEYLLKIV